MRLSCSDTFRSSLPYVSFGEDKFNDSVQPRKEILDPERHVKVALEESGLVLSAT